MISALALCEVTVAIVQPQPVLRALRANTPNMYEASDVLPYALRSGFSGPFRRPEFDTWITINSDGFRGPELKRHADSRLLILGDSFTFGHGVNDQETYAARLSRLLPGIEVINGGFAAGWAPDMYYAWLAARGDRFRPFTLIIAFFLGNDVDGHANVVWERVDERGLPIKLVDTEAHVVDDYYRPRLTPIGYRYPILRESHLFHLAGNVLRQVERFWRGAPGGPSIFDEEYQPDTARAVENTKVIFQGIKWWCDSRGIKLGVVIIPTVQQVRSEAPDKPNRIFAHFFGATGVVYLDLLPSLRGQPDLYYPHDRHWNAEGHRLAAQAISAWVTTNKLLRRS